MERQTPVQKAVRFVTLLYAKTRSGDVTWEQTGVEGVYLAPFANISVRMMRDDNDGELFLRLTDAADHTVDIITPRSLQAPDGLERGEADPLFEQLFEAARRSAMKADDVMDDLLVTLEGGKPKVKR